jgi:cytochrome c oxidase subunit 2
MKVYVTAKQWMWKFAYPEGNRSIAVLYVPVNRPVELVMTSRDVIHSFYVPDFRVKQDVVPGRYTTVWFEVPEPGRYPIFCTEYCGTGHSMMRGEVVALAPADFDRWLASQSERQRIAGQSYVPPAVPGEGAPPEMLSLVVLGRNAAAEHGCLRCHTLDGSRHIGPTWAGLYGSVIPLRDGSVAVADDAFITASMMDPQARIHAGFPPVMPSFQGQIDPADTAAIVELIRSLRDLAPIEPVAPAEGIPIPSTSPPADAGLPERTTP